MIFKKIGTSDRAKENNTPHRGLLQHAIYSIAEIDHCLKNYSSNAGDDKIKVQQQLLDLVAKLKALISNPGEPDLFSDSIVQIANQNKAMEGMGKEITGDQREYLQEFLKFVPLALKQSTKDAWTAFAIDCSKSPYTRQLLAKVITTSCQYHFQSELINKLFVDCHEASPTSNQHVLADLFQIISDNEIEFIKYKIKTNDQVIESWENKISDWSNPGKFDRLFEDYNRELLPLIDNIGIDKSMSSLVKKVSLMQVQRLTDVMDKTIKSMKGSPDYSGQGNLLLKNFVTLLNPYLKLMKKWMNEIPDEMYNNWLKLIRHDFSYNRKPDMIKAIEDIYNDKSHYQAYSLHQTEPSGFLSVASARVSSTASFERQVIYNKDVLTLEDLFTLMHQNILSCTGILSKDLQIAVDKLPDQLIEIATTLNGNHNVDLLEVIHKHPAVTLKYNMPLRNHSARLEIEYNTNAKTFTIHWNFYGLNREGRFDIVAQVLELEGRLQNAILPFAPSFNENSKSLECNWELRADQMTYLNKHIDELIRHYSYLSEETNRHGVYDFITRYLGTEESEQCLATLSDSASHMVVKTMQSLFNTAEINQLLLDYPAYYHYLIN